MAGRTGPTSRMKTDVEVQRAAFDAGIPPDRDFRTWVRAALDRAGDVRSVTIRIVDAAESRRLNREYREKDAPTNVLSFAAGLPGEVLDGLRECGAAPPLGDLVICASLVAAEAAGQGKPVRNHWAHLTIHGVLHLLGHDHRDPAGARAMESCEIELLAGLGIPDPYEQRLV